MVSLKSRLLTGDFFPTSGNFGVAFVVPIWRRSDMTARRKTPLERLAETGTTDRREAFLERRRRAGLARVVVWVPVERADDLRKLAKEWSGSSRAMMVDWLTCRVPVSLSAPIADGHTIELDASGEIRRCTPHRLKVPGSYASSLLVRAISLDELEIQGNPAKWLAGHNLWGMDCPLELLQATLARLWGILGLDPASVLSGALAALHGVIITRIDLTAMYELGSRAEVLAWLRSAQHQASIPHRGRGVFREGSLILGSAKGKAFTRWQVVCYSKGQEVTAHPLPEPIANDEQLSAWTDRQLRIEVRLGRHELMEKGLRTLSVVERNHGGATI